MIATTTEKELAKFTTITGSDWRKSLLAARTRHAHEVIHIELIRRNVAELKKSRKDARK